MANKLLFSRKPTHALVDTDEKCFNKLTDIDCVKNNFNEKILDLSLI